MAVYHFNRSAMGREERQLYTELLKLAYHYERSGEEKFTIIILQETGIIGAYFK